MADCILSIVKVVGERSFLGWADDSDSPGWMKSLGYGPPVPLDKPYYIGSGGHKTDSLQKAQIFGWSKKAQDNLDRYRRDPIYEIIPVKIVEYFS